MEHWWNETDGKAEVFGGKTCPTATLSTTNPTWTDPGSNPGLRGDACFYLEYLCYKQSEKETVQISLDDFVNRVLCVSRFVNNVLLDNRA
jgi:hypothetical protein